MKKITSARRFFSTLLPVFLMMFCSAPLYAEDTGRLNIKAIAMDKLDTAFEAVSRNKEAYLDGLDQIAAFLPDGVSDTLESAVLVADLDMSSDEKLETMVEAAGTDCSIYLIIWLISFFISGIPLVGQFASALGLIGLVLCLLGVI